MEDLNQINGSTQTEEISTIRDKLVNSAVNVGIKDLFPKNKNILSNKKQKPLGNPMDIINKFRMKIFGKPNFTKKKHIFKKQETEKSNNQKNTEDLIHLDIKNYQAPKENKNLHYSLSNFPQNPITQNNHNNKITFLTGIKKNIKSGNNLDENILIIENETDYNNYTLKDFFIKNPNEYDINLNYKTFCDFFNTETKQNIKIQNSKIQKKEKEIFNKIQRKLQADFINKISFPTNEKYLNKTANNFFTNKGMHKIRDYKERVVSADKIRKISNKKDFFNQQKFLKEKKINLYTETKSEGFNPVSYIEGTDKINLIKILNNPISDKNKLNEINTFNLSESSTAHILRMLKINENHEKLGLTKRVTLNTSEKLHEKFLNLKSLSLIKNNTQKSLKNNFFVLQNGLYPPINTENNFCINEKINEHIKFDTQSDLYHHEFKFIEKEFLKTDSVENNNSLPLPGGNNKKNSPTKKGNLKKFTKLINNANNQVFDTNEITSKLPRIKKEQNLFNRINRNNHVKENYEIMSSKQNSIDKIISKPTFEKNNDKENNNSKKLKKN